MFSSGSVSLDAGVSLSTVNSFCLYFPPFWKWIWSCVVLGAETEHLSSLNCAGVDSGSWCAVCSAHWGWDNQPGSWDCALLAGTHTSRSQRREGVASVPSVPPHRPLQTPAFAPPSSWMSESFFQYLPWQPPGFTVHPLGSPSHWACHVIYQAVLLHCLWYVSGSFPTLF